MNTLASTDNAGVSKGGKCKIVSGQSSYFDSEIKGPGGGTIGYLTKISRVRFAISVINGYITKMVRAGLRGE